MPSIREIRSELISELTGVLAPAGYVFNNEWSRFYRRRTSVTSSLGLDLAKSGGEWRLNFWLGIRVHPVEKLLNRDHPLVKKSEAGHTLTVVRRALPMLAELGKFSAPEWRFRSASEVSTRREIVCDAVSDIFLPFLESVTSYDEFVEFMECKSNARFLAPDHDVPVQLAIYYLDERWEDAVSLIEELDELLAAPGRREWILRLVARMTWRVQEMRERVRHLDWIVAEFPRRPEIGAGRDEVE